MPEEGFGLRLSIIDAFSANLKKFGGQIAEAKQGAEGLGAEIEKNKQSFQTVGIAMAAAGAAITAAFTAIVYKTVEAEEELGHMSERTGETVETLSALSYAAKMSGTSIDQIELSLKFLTRAMDDTAKGTGTAKDTFAALGISVVGSEGKLRPMVDVLKDAATKIAAIQDPTRQAAITMELFGARAGTDLLPMLKMGGAGIEEFMKKAKELGLVITQEDVAASMEFDNSMKTLKESLAATGRDIAHVLIPPLMEFMNQAIKIVKNIREWADAHKPLVDILVKVASAVGVFLTVAGGTLLLLPKIVAGIQALNVVLLFLAANPIVLVIAAIAALVAGLIYFYTMSEKFRNAIQTAGAYLEFFGRVVWEVVKTIGVNFKNFLGWFIGAFPDAFRTTLNFIGTFFKNFGINIAKQAVYWAAVLTNPFAALVIKPPDWTPLLKGFKSTIEALPKLVGPNLDEMNKILQSRLVAIGADVAKTKIPPPVIPPFDIDSTKKALLSLTEAEKAWYRERESYAGNFTEFTQKEIENIKDGYKKYYADLVKDSKEAIGKIEDEYFALTHTEKEELDKRWAMEENNITATAKLAGEEANLTDILLKAKTVFYKDYYDKIGKAGTDYQKEMATLNKNETALLEIEIESRKKALEEAGWTAVEITEWEVAYRNKIREEGLSKSEKLQLDYQQEMATIAKDETKLLEIEIEKRIKSFREAGLNEEKIAAWVTAYRAQKAKETTDAIKIELDKETKLTQQYKNELADLELKASGDKQAILDRGWEREKAQLEEEFKSKKRTAEEILAFDEKLAAAKSLYYGKAALEAKAAAKKEVELIEKAEQDIETIRIKATGNKKKILDRGWELLEASLKKEEASIERIEKEKILYYETAAAAEEAIRVKLLDSISEKQKKFYDDSTQQTTDWGNLTTGQIEAIIENLKTLEIEEEKRKNLFESLTATEMKYYSDITGYLGNYTEFTSTKLQEVKDAWANAGSTIATGWTAFLVWMGKQTTNWFETFKKISSDITNVFKSSISAWITQGLTFAGFWAKLTQGLADTWINNFIDKLMETEAIKNVISSLTGLMGNLTTAILNAAKAGLEFAGTAIVKIISGLGSLIGTLWKAITAALSFVSAILKAIWVTIYQTFAWIPLIGPILGFIAATAAVALIIVALGKLTGLISAQKGMAYVPQEMPVMVHPREAILTAPQAEKWRRGEGIAGGGDIFFQRGAIRISHFGNITTEMDEEKFMEKVADRISNQMRRV